MSAQENARALLYTQMSRGYVRQSEVVKLLAQNGLGTARRLEPIVAGELAAIRKLSVSAMFADAARHGADGSSAPVGHWGDVCEGWGAMSWRSKMGSAMESELAIELLEVVVLKNGSEMVSLRGLDPELGKLVILLEHYRDRSSVVMVSAAADVPDERFWPIARRVEELFAA